MVIRSAGLLSMDSSNEYAELIPDAVTGVISNCKRLVSTIYGNDELTRLNVAKKTSAKVHQNLATMYSQIWKTLKYNNPLNARSEEVEALIGKIFSGGKHVTLGLEGYDYSNVYSLLKIADSLDVSNLISKISVVLSDWRSNSMDPINGISKADYNGWYDLLNKSEAENLKDYPYEKLKGNKEIGDLVSKILDYNDVEILQKLSNVTCAPNNSQELAQIALQEIMADISVINNKLYMSAPRAGVGELYKELYGI